jgi:hypothetical protein
LSGRFKILQRAYDFERRGSTNSRRLEYLTTIACPSPPIAEQARPSPAVTADVTARGGDFNHSKKRGWVRAKQKEQNGSKPNRNQYCVEENDAAFGPVHHIATPGSASIPRRWVSMF